MQALWSHYRDLQCIEDMPAHRCGSGEKSTLIQGNRHPKIFPIAVTSEKCPSSFRQYKMTCD
ncbi:hypothetical protein BV25DRAFT_1826140 [Artomyces pyxidatus]|uniref:Uncharacterized protein n=1 Tax=Artomyces pyxidatus TaxID=48021 RepID=A0ACB8T088_9AGAM|nr:hypothetical protein BV25DRAFT_1826140 [Artomyces pyxidatus]